VELLLEYSFSPSLDFHLQKKKVYWHIYYLYRRCLFAAGKGRYIWSFSKVFICREKGKCTGAELVSLQGVYLQQTKENTLF
jgi:hypothetical protein